MTAAAVISVARSFVGTPFVHRGRTPGVGLDCAGLVVCTAQALGIEHVDVEVYGHLPLNGLQQETLAGQPALSEVPRHQMAPGDILLMRFGRNPQHLAIHAGDTIIHAFEAPGVVCEHDLTALWQSRIVRVYRFSGIEP